MTTPREQDLKHFVSKDKERLIYDCKGLQQWLLYTPSGREILSKERLFFTQNVNHIFGAFSLQIGLSDINFLHGNKINQHFTINVDMIADLRFLPIKSDSIDLIVCPHVLEFTNNYHHVLQELYRVLSPNGKLILTCFNKYSWFGLCKNRVPLLKKARLISLNSLRSQLEALNFAIEGGKFFGYCPPFSKSRRLKRYHWMNLVGDRWFPTMANSFALILRKEIVTPTLIKYKDLESFSTISPTFGTARVCNKQN